MTLGRWIYGADLNNRLTDKESVDASKLRGGKKNRHQRDLSEIRARARDEARRRLSLVVTGLLGVVATYSYLRSDDDAIPSDDPHALTSPPDNPSLPPFPSIPATLNRPRDYYTRIQNPSTLPHDADVKARFDFQEQWQNTTEQALDRFKNHPQAKILIDHFKRHGLMSIPHGPQVIEVIYKGDSSGPEMALSNPLSFAVTYMPDIFSAGMNRSVITQYSDPPITIRIAGTTKCQEWLAIFLLHELKHVHDLQVKGENPNNPKEYLAGEVGAHQFENELLREWNPEAYDFFIKEAKRLFLDSNGNTDGVMRLIHELYPVDDLTPGIQAAAQASLCTAMFFEVAQERGFDQKALQKLYSAIYSDSESGSPIFPHTYSLLTAPQGF